MTARDWRPVLVVLAAVAALTLTACGGGASTPDSTLPPGVSPTPPPSSPVEGVVVKIETSGLNDFRGFQLRMDDGRVVPFTLGRLENATEFPPSHLTEHMAAADRLRISFHPDGGNLVVTRIEHAAGTSPPPS